VRCCRVGFLVRVVDRLISRSLRFGLVGLLVCFCLGLGGVSLGDGDVRLGFGFFLLYLGIGFRSGLGFLGARPWRQSLSAFASALAAGVVVVVGDVAVDWAANTEVANRPAIRVATILLMAMFPSVLSLQFGR
jgi:hypothetical protein